MSSGRVGAFAPRLDATERAALDYLFGDWQRLFHVTTIPQALAGLGEPSAGDARWRIAAQLRVLRDTLPPVQHWGFPHFVLTEEEKLVGRHLAALAPAGRTRRRLDDLSTVLGRPAAAIAAAAASLERLALLDHTCNGAWLSWMFRADWRQRLGPLGFTWHTLARPSGASFGVP